MKKVLFMMVMMLSMTVNATSAKDKDTTCFVTHMTVTTYKSGDKIQTKDGTEVSNKKIKNGTQRICAISPDMLWCIPLGSVIEIEGHGQYEVRDTTSTCLNHTVDILVHRNAETFKEEKIKVRVIKKGEKQQASAK